MDKDRAWSFGAVTGAVTALIGWVPGLAVGALAETHSAAYRAAHTGGQAIGYWSFMPWRTGFICGWVITILPVAIVVAWFLGFNPFSADQSTRAKRDRAAQREQSLYEDEAAALLGLPATRKRGRGTAGTVQDAGTVVGGLVIGTAGGIAAGIATMAVGLVIGVAFLIVPIGALFLILG